MSTIFPHPHRLRLTREMVEMLAKHQDTFAKGGVITLEKDEAGLWIVLPQGTKWFLGVAEPVGQKRKRLSRKVH